jgi:hypothetical protein
MARHSGETATGAAFRRQIETVKDGVCITQVASEYGLFKAAPSGRLIGRCISPDHEDKTPSFVVYRQGQRFHCFGCQARGDVVDLVRLAEPTMAVWEIMLALAMRFGIELPTRPASWFDRQRRQRPIRERIEAERVEHIRELVFRLVFAPWLRRLPEGARETAANSAWRESLNIARMVYAKRRGA